MLERKVLIIDPEEDFCLYLQYCLSKRNCIVDYSLDLSQGLTKIELTRPNVIVADINMEENVEEKIENKSKEIKGYLPNVILVDTETRAGNNLFDFIIKLFK